MSCPSSETAAAWLLNELSEEQAEAFEEHYFACDACFQRTAALENAHRLLKSALPAVLTPERRRALEGEHAVSVPVSPRERQVMRLDPEHPVGFWLLRADLTDAARVDIAAFDPAGNSVLSLRDVPFDATEGAVTLACQLHYRDLTPGNQLHAELTVFDAGGRERRYEGYVLDHDFRT